MASHDETGHEAPAHATSGAHRPRPDDTPPRNGVIFTYTILAVMTLFGLKYVFDSYLDVSQRDIRRSNIEESRTTRELAEYREAQAERLGGGSMPIDRAVSELARRGRGAFPLIRPTPSEDLDPLRGWSQLPREVEAPAPPPAPVPAEGAAPVEGAAPAEGAAAPAEGAAAPAEGAAAPAEGAAAPAEGAAAPAEGAAPAAP